MGKLPVEVLERYVLARLGVSDPAVLVGPAYGEDASIIDLGDGRVLVVHVDPITGAVEHLGWLAVHIACNDVAVCGARPRWLLPVLYLPEGSGLDVVDKVTSQVDEAAREVGAMVVGGHSEYTPGLTRPLISMTAIGVTSRDRYVTTSGARPGDVILMTKTAGVEGTAILASDFKDVLLERGVPQELLERGRRFIRVVSVVREALALAELGVHAMHDPTEGGLLGGLAELAYASNVMVEVWEDEVPVAEETRVLCEALSIDPLKLISSGVLIAALPEDKADEAVKELKELNVNASVIGRVREGKGLVVHRSDGRVEKIGRFVEDELFRLWELTPRR